MKLIINDDNLQIKEIHEFNKKVRALLIDENNQVLIANYGGVFLLPGGSIEKDETILGALIRELNEETGQKYTQEDFEYLLSIEYFQKDYPKRNHTFENRLIETYYYIGNFKEILKSSQTLTSEEKKDNFGLQLIPLEKLESIIKENDTNNPRNIYFQKELLTVLKAFQETKNKILKRKRIKND